MRQIVCGLMFVASVVFACGGQDDSTTAEDESAVSTPVTSVEVISVPPLGATTIYCSIGFHSASDDAICRRCERACRDAGRGSCKTATVDGHWAYADCATGEDYINFEPSVD